MEDKRDYYVYVYIDPRNYEEFYYGKGKGKRKVAHLSDIDEDSEKVKRIKDIKKAGQEPIIKVIAAGLKAEEAFLVEKTLIWKLGRTLTNVSSGYFADKFRPHDTLHREIKGFDYDNGIYLLNVGEGNHRSWIDCRSYGFMSAGQGKRYRKLMQEFRPGDILAAYWSKKGLRGGYVGIGIVQANAVSVNEFRFDGKPLSKLRLAQPNIFENSDNLDKAEWMVATKWVATVAAEERKWHSKAGLFSTPSTKASLDKQIATLYFLEVQFGVKFAELRV